MNSDALIVYVDMDDVLCDYTTAFEKARAAFPEVTYPQSQYGFYAGLAPIEGAINGVKTLYDSGKYEVYILTAPSIYNPMCYTEKRIWVEKHLGMEFVQRLIISPDKGLLKGDFLIDDRIEGHGQENFDGELIQFGSKEWPTWTRLLKKIKETNWRG